MVGRANFFLDELLTAVVEIVSVINSQPLSCVSSTDYEEPLIPSHLAVCWKLLNLLDYLGHICDSENEDFELTKEVKHLVSILNHFWKRRRSEYLNKVRESHRYSARKTPPHSSVSKGDVVIVHDDSLPCEFWKLVLIQEVLSGHDNQPRAALVRVASGDHQHVLSRRPLQLLYSLEIHDPEMLEPGSRAAPASCPDVHISVPVGKNDAPTHKRPKRCQIQVAAKRATEKMMAWAQELQQD